MINTALWVFVPDPAVLSAFLIPIQILSRAAVNCDRPILLNMDGLIIISLGTGIV